MQLLTEEEAFDLLLKAFYESHHEILNPHDPRHREATDILGCLLNDMESGALEAYLEGGKVRVRPTVKQ